MFESCLKKQEELKKLFSDCTDQEACYLKIIELGKQPSSYQEKYKTKDHLVQGCQSEMFLHSWLEGDCIHFELFSDALISAGLGMMMLKVYSGESPETILKCPPSFITDLGIPSALTPGRANGLASLHLRMKQEALHWLLKMDKQKN